MGVLPMTEAMAASIRRGGDESAIEILAVAMVSLVGPLWFSASLRH